MKQLKCKNCGAPLISYDGNSIIICKSCGSNYAAKAKFELQTDDNTSIDDHLTLIKKSIDEKYQKLIIELQFLEEQFIETAHPSIPLKIKNIKNKINQLTPNGGTFE